MITLGDYVDKLKLRLPSIFEDDDDIPDTMTDSKGNVVPKPGHLLDPSARPIRPPKKNAPRTK